MSIFEVFLKILFHIKVNCFDAYLLTNLPILVGIETILFQEVPKYPLEKYTFIKIFYHFLSKRLSTYVIFLTELESDKFQLLTSCILE